MTSPTDLLSLRDAAEELGLTKSTLQTQVKAGHFPSAVKIGPVWAVTRGDVERYRSTRKGKNQGPKADG